MNNAPIPGLDVDIDVHGDVAVVHARGEVDLTTSSILAEGIEAALAKTPSGIVVDLAGVSFLASVGMSVLITARRTAGSAAALVVVADGPSTRRPMELVGLDASIPLYTDVEAALASLSKTSPPSSQHSGDVVAMPRIAAEDEQAEEIA